MRASRVQARRIRREGFRRKGSGEEGADARGSARRAQARTGRRPRARRGARGRSRTPAGGVPRGRAAPGEPPAIRSASPRARRRARMSPREARGRAPRAAEERTVEGVVELLGNGSAFLRVSPPEASDEDVYISAAQVRRCELVSGDRVSGPVRTPRQSERYPSLARVDTINGAPAESVAEGTRYEDLAVAYPSERLELDPQDPTLGAIEWLTPIGRGSRASIVGEARSGKTETLRRLLGALVRPRGPGGDARAQRRPPRGDRRLARGARGARRRVGSRRLRRASGSDRGARGGHRQARRRARRARGGADRHARLPPTACRPADPRRRPQPRRGRLAHTDRDRHPSARRREHA